MTMPVFDCHAEIGRFRTLLGILGAAVASCFFFWLLLGWFGWVPAMVDVFGADGMRTPASVTVAGLLLAAIAFWEC